METSLVVKAYLVYLPVAIGLTLYVAHILFKNSKIFMLDIFRGRAEIALATNKLFEVGFYLMNIGFALLILKMSSMPDTQTMIEELSLKLGAFSIYLGAMMMVNLFFFFRGKRKSKEAQRREELFSIPNAE